MTNLKSIIIVLWGALLVSAAPAFADQELIVSAAASLTNALPEVAGQFEERPIPASRSSVILGRRGPCSNKLLKAPRWTCLRRRIKRP